ncbi:MAG: hypothetical protein K2M94_04565 [Paramuribaculum sp.]|nr:hypothetical protein [Paramuribaculum sp.]
MKRVLSLLFCISIFIIAEAADWSKYKGVFIFNRVEGQSVYNGNKRVVDFDATKEGYQDNPYCKIEIGADWVGVPNIVYSIVGSKVKPDGTVLLKLKDDGWGITATMEIHTDKTINFYGTDGGKIVHSTWYTKLHSFKKK